MYGRKYQKGLNIVTTLAMITKTTTTVTTIRLQPTIVPRPSAIATATFTQFGMNLVESSSIFLKLVSVFLVSSGSGTVFYLPRKRSVSE